ncbi:MAG: amino acid ABC transporter permease [Brotaphodocola sp.]
MANTFKPGTIPGYIPRVLAALPETMKILLLSLLFGLMIGALIALASLSKNKGLLAFAKGYVAFIRGIPTLVWIFLVYLGLPQVVMAVCGVNLTSLLSKTTFIIICLALSSSANQAEMMRASYLAVNKSQKEAALSIGMTPFMAFRRIIFPQAFGIAIPALGNNIIMLFKETSLAFSIGVLDLVGKARAVSSASYGANRLEVYIATGFIFWMICILLEQGSKLVEKMYTKGRKQATS